MGFVHRRVAELTAARLIAENDPITRVPLKFIGDQYGRSALFQMKLGVCLRFVARYGNAAYGHVHHGHIDSRIGAKMLFDRFGDSVSVAR